ncbi:uncharacterized protein isoform X3 [Rhodnius prolixus]|uniref:uncharacterized protein isoform X3 n=1 Tax=Rhodnius prolixus TaxID=13249 RepID=UPI003D18AE02
MSETMDKHVDKPECEDCSEDSEGALSALLHKLASEDFSLIEKNVFSEDDTCTCQSCNERRTLAKGTLEELKMIQSYWLELRQYIRIVYRLSMKGSLKSIDDDYLAYMKDIVARLCEVCNPHQLYQRLEAQVREFVVEVKVRLLQLMDRLADNPQLPRLFISGMLDRYNKMMNAANEISPVLKQLEVDHLSKFNLTWKVLNQRLFQTSIYTDLFFQNSVPLFITQLSSEENKMLVREFLSFDDEITLVEGMWTDVEARINQYTQNQATNLAKQRFLKDEWHEFKALRRTRDKLCHKLTTASEKLTDTNFRTSENKDSTTESQMTENVEDANHHVEGRLPVDCDSNDQQNLVQESCECHVCQDATSHTPVEYMDHVLPLPAPRGGFHLYRHIHGTGDGSVDKATQKDQEVINSLNEFIRLSDEQLYSSPVASRNTKDKGTDTGSQVHHAHCNKHSDTIKRIPCVEQEDEGSLMLNGNEDSHSDVSQNDPRHCDCCYCEVFGHGLPAAAPMSRNYQEMRERLRLLLNKKKSKCKSSSANSNHPQQIPQKKQQIPVNSSENEGDTRALEDLIEYIEGTEVKCRNEKKAAKKARQKEKKRILLIRKKTEEEERARMIEEMERRKREEEAAALRQKEEREAALLRALQNKSGKKKGNKKRAVSNNGRGNSNTSSSNHNKTEQTPPGPQMVTIKRVMEPHNSEPTVTITLRGATPNQDRVLYTLLNGQVCKMKDVENSVKNVNKSNVGKSAINCNDQTSQNQPNGKKSKKKETPNNINNNNINSNSNNNNNISNNNLNSITPNLTAGIRTISQGVSFSPTLPLCKGVQLPQANQIPVSEGSVKIHSGKGLTNPTSIQINNAINSLSRPHSFSIDDIKLPPGITITKVDPLVKSRQPTLENEEETLKKISSSAKLKTTPSEVIVVATSKFKDLAQNKGCESDSGPETPSSKNKKKNKKRDVPSSVIEMGDHSPYPGLEIEPISLSPHSRQNQSQNDIVSRMSVLTISPYGDSKEPSVTTIKVPHPDLELHQVRNQVQQQQLPQASQLGVEHNKKKKKKNKKSHSNSSMNPDEWNLLDSVFAPKDIDLNDGEIDDAERELEAFKRFCLQSVPPKRKEKVHLNIKDIILKKKSSTITCS